MQYKLVKCVDLSHSEVKYIGFDETSTTNRFRDFWESLQNARIIPNPVSVYSPDAQSKVQDLPDEIKEKIYCAVKARIFSTNDKWERMLFGFYIAIDMWRKQIGIITLFFVIVGIFIG